MGAKLRPGNVHSAEDWEEVLLPEIQHYLYVEYVTSKSVTLIYVTKATQPSVLVDVSYPSNGDQPATLPLPEPLCSLPMRKERRRRHPRRRRSGS
jgi:hypothetical protein